MRYKMQGCKDHKRLSSKRKSVAMNNNGTMCSEQVSKWNNVSSMTWETLRNINPNITNIKVWHQKV